MLWIATSSPEITKDQAINIRSEGFKLDELLPLSVELARVGISLTISIVFEDSELQ